MSTVEDCFSDVEQLSVWTYLFLLSATVNVLFVLYLSALVTIRRFHAWKRRKHFSYRKFRHTAAGTEDFVYTNRHRIALCVADTTVYLLVFGGAIYLLIAVAIANAFTLEECRLIATTTGVFSILIGRLCFAIFVNGFLMKGDVEYFAKQLMEQAVVAVVHVALFRSGDALLTRSLLCVMMADGHVANVGHIAAACRQPAGRALVLRLKAFRAFVALAFRGLLPLVCLLVSLLAFDNGDFMEMSYAAITMASGCGVVFTAYNIYVIVTSLRDMWNAHVLHFSRLGQLDGHRRVDKIHNCDSTRSKNKNMLDMKGSIVLNNVIQSELSTKNVIRNPRTDLNTAINPIVNKLWLHLQPTSQPNGSGITRHKHVLNISSKVNTNKLNIPETIEEGQCE